MSMTDERRPAPPQIQGAEAVAGSQYPAGVGFNLKLEPFVPFYGETGYDGQYNVYTMGVGATERDAINGADVLVGAGDGETPAVTDLGTQVIGTDNGMIDPTRLAQWSYFGQDMWVALRRRCTFPDTTGTKVSEPSTFKFYMPHYDEPYYNVDVSANVAPYPVATTIFTASNTFPNACKAGDVYFMFRQQHKTFSKVCMVISFLDHAGKTDTPYYTDGTPLYFNESDGSAALYNPERVQDLFTSTSQDVTSLVDNWRVEGYNFSGTVHYHVLIGNITLTNTLDCLRFRLQDEVSAYKMYFHLFIDGKYADPSSVMLGRGISHLTDPGNTHYNGYDIGDTVKTLSTINGSLDKVAVKFDIPTRDGSPLGWGVSAAPSTYTSCPGEEGDCS